MHISIRIRKCCDKLFFQNPNSIPYFRVIAFCNRKRRNNYLAEILKTSRTKKLIQNHKWMSDYFVNLNVRKKNCKSGNRIIECKL